jgi:hypothetical protein
VCGEKVSECKSSSFEVADYESNPSLLVTGCCQSPSDENEYATKMEESDCRRPAIWREFFLFIGLTGYFASLGCVWCLLVASVFFGSGLCPCSPLARTALQRVVWRPGYNFICSCNGKHDIIQPCGSVPSSWNMSIIFCGSLGQTGKYSLILMHSG